MTKTEIIQKIDKAFKDYDTAPGFIRFGAFSNLNLILKNLWPDIKKHLQQIQGFSYMENNTIDKMKQRLKKQTQAIKEIQHINNIALSIYNLRKEEPLKNGKIKERIIIPINNLRIKDIIDKILRDKK